MSHSVSKPPPLLVMTFLAIPAFSAWTWNKKNASAPAVPTVPPITQRLPVEIIPSDDKPITLENCICLPKNAVEKYSPKIGNVVLGDCVSEGVTFTKPVEN